MSMQSVDEIKNKLTIEQIADLVAEFGGEPVIINSNMLILKTICHNPFGVECSRKLYYYDNTKLFKCYTDCGDYFDIFELVCRVMNINHKQKLNGKNDKWEVFDGVTYIIKYFNLNINVNNLDNGFINDLTDWNIFKEYDKIDSASLLNQNVQFKDLPNDVIKFFPQPHILTWEEEGIKFDILQYFNIKFNPISCGILIPHYSTDDKLIGIRERTLVEEYEHFGKYRPAIISGIMYNHPLGYNLFGLDKAKSAIQITKKAIVFEGEKSPMLYASYFGKENNIAVATCGSSFTFYQLNLLRAAGAEEIIIAFDKQFKELGDDEFRRWTKKLIDFSNRFSPYVKVSFMFDKWGYLDYKDAPIDKGADTFIELYNRRFSYEI